MNPNESTTATPLTSHLFPLGRRDIAIAFALLLLTGLLFSRSLQNDFVDFDDREYIVHNNHINTGVSVEGLEWISTAVVVSNWHPLTMFTHMLDCQFYGLNPMGHHLTNIVLHSFNVALLYLLLRRITGQLWPSLVAAAIFGWHPLRVESVTWVAERKDVLSLFFGLSCLWAYSEWTQRRGVGWYIASCVLLTLGLVSKPMMVTLPCVMLLLDFWPLGTLRADGWRPRAGDVGRRVLEKLPMFAIVLVFVMITLRTQESTVAGSSGTFVYKLMLSVVSYADYAGQLFYPVNLAVYYPPSERPNEAINLFMSLGGLILVTVLFASRAREAPHLLFGWLWFLGTAVPIIGVVKAGDQAHADRYTYLPMIGLVIALAFEVERWMATSQRRVLLSVVAASWIAVLAGLTWVQEGYWKNTETLFRHALEVTGPNFVAEMGVAHAVLEQGEIEEGIKHLDRAAELAPNLPLPMFTKATSLQQLHRWDESQAAFEEMLKRGGDGPIQRTHYGELLLSMGNWRDARSHFFESIRQLPEYVPALAGMAQAESRLGNYDEAVKWLGEARRLDSSDALAARRAAWLLATCPADGYRDGNSALSAAKVLFAYDRPKSALSLDTLAAAQAENGQFDEAVATARAALAAAQEEMKLNPNRKVLADAIEQRLALYEQHKPYRQTPDDRSQ